MRFCPGNKSIFLGKGDGKMIKHVPVVSVMLTMAVTVIPVSAADPIDGKKAFELRCAGCHPDGGNVVNPVKALHKINREANGVKTVKDIIKVIRKPGPGMPAFDKKAISNAEAKAIAGYILKTFK